LWSIVPVRWRRSRRSSHPSAITDKRCVGFHVLADDDRAITPSAVHTRGEGRRQRDPGQVPRLAALGRKHARDGLIHQQLDLRVGRLCRFDRHNVRSRPWQVFNARLEGPARHRTGGHSAHERKHQ
jgi:hypothetical protein